MLENHLSGFVQRTRETSHPRDETPHETWRYHRLMSAGRDLRVNVLVVGVLVVGILVVGILVVGILVVGVLVVLALQGITDQASVVPDDTAIRSP